MLPSVLLLLFTGASEPDGVVRAPAGRRTYILPDGRRVRATPDEVEVLLRKPEPAPPEKKPKAVLRTPRLAGALPSFMEPLAPEVLVPLAQPAPIQRRMQAMPDLRALRQRGDEDAVAALLLL